MQETRCSDDDLTPAEFSPRGYHGHWLHASKRGYSGVAIYSRRKPDKLIRGFGSKEFDGEGRYLEARFGDLSVVSLYLPSGSSSPERQAAKFRFLAEFLPYVERLRRASPSLRPVRGLEHRAPSDRPEELALESEEFGLSARGAGVAR